MREDFDCKRMVLIWCFWVLTVRERRARKERGNGRDNEIEREKKENEVMEKERVGEIILKKRI